MGLRSWPITSTVPTPPTPRADRCGDSRAHLRAVDFGPRRDATATTATATMPGKGRRRGVVRGRHATVPELAERPARRSPTDEAPARRARARDPREPPGGRGGENAAGADLRGRRPAWRRRNAELDRPPTSTGMRLRLRLACRGRRPARPGRGTRAPVAAPDLRRMVGGGPRGRRRVPAGSGSAEERARTTGAAGWST